MVLTPGTAGEGRAEVNVWGKKEGEKKENGGGGRATVGSGTKVFTIDMEPVATMIMNLTFVFLLTFTTVTGDTISACFGANKSLDIDCGAGHMIHITRTFYGFSPTNQCRLVDGEVGLPGAQWTTTRITRVWGRGLAASTCPLASGGQCPNVRAAQQLLSSGVYLCLGVQ
ncbi:hypothetical protein Btru_077602 [Bulinus truncatus]|nr:hypothetical protein Btru_077602 [Bulinus truncatus]